MDPLSKEFVRLVEATGWTQREVARQLDLTEGAVSHIMKGRNRPSPAVVRLFKLVVESGPGGSISATGRAAKPLEPWEVKLLKKLRTLKPAQRDRVLTALEAMIGAMK